MKRWILVGCVLIAGHAAAQVNKCVDAAGKVSYGEAPCAATQRGGQVLGRGATEPVHDPYAAQRTMDTYRRASAIQRSTLDAVTRQSQSQDPGAVLMDHKPNERIDAQSKRNMDRRMAELEADEQRRGEMDERRRLQREKAQAEARQGPIQLTNCDGSGCWDTRGNRYNATGDGSKFFRNDGKFCRSDGIRIICN